MDERDFAILAMLHETNNITRAADLLYTTQSALSKRISAIEQELDTTILLRSRQGIRFTPQGEEIWARTREAARQLSQMRESLAMSRDYISGTLNAGISINYAQYTLPDLLAAYRRHFPHVNTHIVTDQSRKLYQLLSEGSIDVAVIRGEYPWKDNQVCLSREAVCSVCCEADAGKSLKDIPYIGRQTDSVLERQIAQWMRENSLQPESHGIHVDSIATCMEMVKRGIGWAILPEICLKDFPGRASPLFFQNGEAFVRSTYLMYTDAVLALPQAEAFIHIVTNSAQATMTERGKH